MDTCATTTRSDKYNVAGTWNWGVHFLFPRLPQLHCRARDVIAFT